MQRKYLNIIRYVVVLLLINQFMSYNNITHYVYKDDGFYKSTECYYNDYIMNDINIISIINRPVIYEGINQKEFVTPYRLIIKTNVFYCKPKILYNNYITFNSYELITEYKPHFKYSNDTYILKTTSFLFKKEIDITDQFKRDV